jgi:hypothetical protein
MKLLLDEKGINSGRASGYYRNEVKRYLNPFNPVFAYGKIIIAEEHADEFFTGVKDWKGFYLIELPSGNQSTAPFMWMINHLKSGRHKWESFDSHPEGANTLLEIRKHRGNHPVMIVPNTFLRPLGNKYAKHVLENLDD